MVLYVVKILEAGGQRVFDYVLSICTYNCIFLNSLMSFANSLIISSVEEGTCCVCRVVHTAQVVSLIIDAMAYLLTHIKNRSCLTEIPILMSLQ